MKKRFFSILLSLAMMVTMMPSMVVFADQAVTYLKADGTTASITDYQVLPECSGEATKTIAAGTYVVNQTNDRDTASQLKINGNATIIIKESYSLFLKGLDLNGYTLKVFAGRTSSGSIYELNIYGRHSSAIYSDTGTLEINSGNCYLQGGCTEQLTYAYDTISGDSKIVVNNGRLGLGGCAAASGTTAIAKHVGIGGGITINNCVSFLAHGGMKHTIGTAPEIPDFSEVKTAFISTDVGKVTLNGEYNISGSNYNISTQQDGENIPILQSNFNTQMHLYNNIFITPKSDSGTGGGGTGGGGGAGGSGDTAPEANAPSVDVTGAVLVKTENGKKEASVDVSSAVNTLLKNATESKAKEITINAKTSANVDKVDVTIPADAFAQLAKIDSLNDAVISTGVCDFTIDKQALAEIAKQAPAGSKLTIEAVESPTSNKLQTVYELKITAGNKKIRSFNGGQIMVTVDVPSELKGQPATCLYKNENGIYSSTFVSKWSSDSAKLSFVTQHFSKYIVMSVDEATKLLVKQAKPKQKSIKALKGKKIAVSFKKLSIGNVSADAVKYTVQRSTSKKFKKAVKNFTVKSSKSVIKYTDSKKLKKGTKYYYRVRATVLLSNGSKVNSKWSTAKSAKCK